jgi:glycosyltransferase involved in cell wall biosynthesis
MLRDFAVLRFNNYRRIDNRGVYQGSLSMPLISVIIPTHNRPEMLAEALASVREQTFKDIEIIVVSNGESPEMRRASREVAAGCIYFSLDKGNVSSARNFAATRASGEWIAFLDDDDIWLPTKLERQLAVANCTTADAVTCDVIEFFPGGIEAINRPRIPDNWSYTKAISHYRWSGIPSSCLFRRRALDNVGGFDPNLSYVEDMDLLHRISWDHTIHQMEEVLCRHRRGHLNTLHPRNRRRRAWWELRHYLKMIRVTPAQLRDTLPNFTDFVSPRFIPLLAGGLHPRARLKRWLKKFKSTSKIATSR